ESGDELAVGEARLLHGNLHVKSYEKIPLLASTNLWGDYPTSTSAPRRSTSCAACCGSSGWLSRRVRQRCVRQPSRRWRTPTTTSPWPCGCAWASCSKRSPATLRPCSASRPTSPSSPAGTCAASATRPPPVLG